MCSINQKAVEQHKAVQIVRAGKDHTFELDFPVLKSLLTQDKVKDRSVVVLCVAGAFRKGKSFILDFLLRYLKWRYDRCSLEPPEDADWLGPSDEPLDGFSWRGGSERDTTGILVWPEIFLASVPEKGDVAILLLDTQGTFDSDSTVRECAIIFALSTMVSSVQVYNLSHNIQEDDLQHLQLFTDYGRLVLADSGQKPFQRLFFLIRDWSYPYDAQYGEVGGELILRKRLNTAENQHPELKSVREHIYSCFSDIGCFLMPHPGLKVASNPHFDGKLCDIEDDFKDALRRLAPLLLAPQNLVVKKIGGHTVKVKELLIYFKSYLEIYSGEVLPEPKSVLTATAEANNLAAMAAAKENYQSAMEKVCGGSRPFLSPSILQNKHQHFKALALEKFFNAKKMGGEKFSEVYKSKLEVEIEDYYKKLVLFNESKNLLKFTRTPVVSFCVIVAFYVLSALFRLCGLYSLSNFASLCMGIVICSVIFWIYIKYSGEYILIGEYIDNLTMCIWLEVIKPNYTILLQNALKPTSEKLQAGFSNSHSEGD